MNHSSIQLEGNDIRTCSLELFLPLITGKFSRNASIYMVVGHIKQMVAHFSAKYTYVTKLLVPKDVVSHTSRSLTSGFVRNRYLRIQYKCLEYSLIYHICPA